jgi:hypothetical protein
MFETYIASESSLFRRLTSFNVSWKLLTLLLAGFMLIALAIWFVLTPYLTLWNMRNAAYNRDATTFCSYIDFPVLRENLKAEINARMLFELNKDEKLKSDLFAGLATIAGPSIVNNMVDGYVTPAAIELLFKGETRQKDTQANFGAEIFTKDFLSGQNGEVTSTYKTFNEFQIAYKPKNGEQILLILERRSLIRWQLTAMKFR